MRLSEFKAALGNVARPNLFQARITGYERISSVNIGDTFTFRCETAETPGRTIQTTDDQGHGGPTIKMASDITYNDVSLTIICSEDMKERFFFEQWMDSIVYPAETARSSGLVSFYEDYAMNTTLEVDMLDSANRKIYTSRMYYVYPTSLSPMSASWEDTNTYQRFNVTMNYRFYTYTRYT